MRRSTAKVKTLAGAIGVILSLPFSFASAANGELRAGMDASSLAQLAQSQNVLDAWRDYALADLTPDFSWADHRNPAASAPTLFDRGRGRFAAPASRFNAGAINEPQPLQVAYLHTKVADTPLSVAGDASGVLQELTPGLQRNVIAPSLTQRWGDHSALTISAIFAYQRFAGIGMGADAAPTQDTFGMTPFQYRENSTSYGAGMRVDFNSAITQDWSWQAGYQTRVNMDAFNNYRGLHSEPGSFDIPASVNLGLGWSATPDLKFDLDYERVMYSQIAPFTSNALPTPFLVLLGSAISPAFQWQDLDVYSLGASLRDQSNGTWSLRYATREQPLPTSPLLQLVLQPYVSGHDVEFGYTHLFGLNSSLHLAATYAPTQFVLGLPASYNLRQPNGNQLEYELTWTTRF